jgi:hypothetical protein
VAHPHGSSLVFCGQTPIGQRSSTPAGWLRQELRVSQSLWAMPASQWDARGGIVSTKNEKHFRKPSRSYFRGMVAKATSGELHLKRSLWASRRASNPEREVGGAA